MAAGPRGRHAVPRWPRPLPAGGPTEPRPTWPHVGPSGWAGLWQKGHRARAQGGPPPRSRTTWRGGRGECARGPGPADTRALPGSLSRLETSEADFIPATRTISRTGWRRGSVGRFRLRRKKPKGSGESACVCPTRFCAWRAFQGHGCRSQCARGRQDDESRGGEQPPKSWQRRTVSRMRTRRTQDAASPAPSPAPPEAESEPGQHKPCPQTGRR